MVFSSLAMYFLVVTKQSRFYFSEMIVGEIVIRSPLQAVVANIPAYYIYIYIYIQSTYHSCYYDYRQQWEQFVGSAFTNSQNMFEGNFICPSGTSQSSKHTSQCRV